jgi:N-acetylglutamate synthase-like GNAT family acetyltransferase
MSIAIRECLAQDASAIAELLGQLGYPTTEHEVAHRLIYWDGDAFSKVLVAEQVGRVVGVLAVHAIPYLEKTGRWARIESLAVDDQARQSGVGRALVVAAEGIAQQWGCPAVEVTSMRSRHDAQAFYRHLGYSDACPHAARFWKTLRPPC